MPAKGWRKDEQESNFDTVLLNEQLSIDNFLFPKSTTNKLSKQALYDSNNQSNFLLAKDTQTVIQRSSILFINFIYHHAKQLVKLQNRKIVNADDILNALTQVGFADFIPNLNIELEKFNEKKEAKKLARAKLKADKESAIINNNLDDVDVDVDIETNDNTNDISNKRLKLDNSINDETISENDLTIQNVDLTKNDENENENENEDKEQTDNELEEEEEEEDDDDEGEDENGDGDDDDTDEVDKIQNHVPSQLELEQKELAGDDPDKFDINDNNNNNDDDNDDDDDDHLSNNEE
jgi:DNA polymerase epsilon subunit 3